MSTLYLFNPENDSALASDDDNYTPSRAAMQLHIDGALLPLWWAGDDDYILARNTSEIESFKRKFNLKGKAVDSVSGISIDSCVPWGWSKYARRQFLKAGVNPAVLPDDGKLEALRQLSHRRVTIRLMNELHACKILDSLPHSPIEVRNVDDIPPGACHIKLPWSSSGRGVMACHRNTLNQTQLQRIQGMIRRQGSVIVEQSLDKIQDFAMLFYLREGACTFEGYSLFSTEANGAYKGNIVAPAGHISQLASQIIDARSAQRLIDFYEDALPRIYSPCYEGWIGIDMMLYRNSCGKRLIAPCVEVNMRYTMGVVALQLGRNERLRHCIPAQFMVGMSAVTHASDIKLLPDGEIFSFTIRELEPALKL